MTCTSHANSDSLKTQNMESDATGKFVNYLDTDIHITIETSHVLPFEA